MKRIVVILGACYALLFAWVTPGCTGVSTGATEYTISGGVSDEVTGGAVVGAQITLGGVTGQAFSDSNGIFNLSAVVASPVAVTVQAPGYAPRSYAVTILPHAVASNLMVTLRPVDQVVSITVPRGADAAVQISQAHADGQVVFSIPPDTLVTPTGQLAVGNANVAITYWHPLQSLRSAPGDLYASNPNGAGVMPLQSFGMSEIEVTQGNVILQIAPGKTAPLAFTVPPAMRYLLGVSTYATPNLYYMNRQTGVWDQAGSIQAGNLDLDANNTTFTAQLPHLSGWNIDGLEPSVGGCVTGHVYNTCHNPLGYAKLELYFMEWEELADFQVNSDADGVYCANTATHPVYSVHGADDTTAYLSAANNLQNSSLCNPSPGEPIPAVCLGCANNESACCRYGIDYGVPYGDTVFINPDNGDPIPTCDGGAYIYNIMHWTSGGISDAECHLVCDALPDITVEPCHICPGSGWPNVWCYGYDAGQGFDNNCDQMPDVIINDGDPDCPVTAPGPPVELICKPQLPGTPCPNTAFCCNPQLECADQVCVPLNDP